MNLDNYMWKWTSDEKIVAYGEGALKYLTQVQTGKTVIVTARSLIGTEFVSNIISLTDGEVILGPRQYAPPEEVSHLKEQVSKFDTAVSVGGGSVIDAVKQVLNVKHIAIPTTLSGSEHTGRSSVYSGGVKFRAPARAPDVVILDPENLSNTPRRLLLTTGIKAVDHAVEALYSQNASPVSDMLAIEGYRRLTKGLRNIDSRDSKFECQLGAWFSTLAFSTGNGLSHMFSYVFAPRFGIPHGVASCISLPAAVKTNYYKEKERLRVIEEGEPLYVTLERFINELGVASKLSEYASLEESLQLCDELTNQVNSTGNCRTTISREEVQKFILEVF